MLAWLFHIISRQQAFLLGGPIGQTVNDVLSNISCSSFAGHVLVWISWLICNWMAHVSCCVEVVNATDGPAHWPTRTPHSKSPFFPLTWILAMFTWLLLHPHLSAMSWRPLQHGMNTECEWNPKHSCLSPWGLELSLKYAITNGNWYKSRDGESIAAVVWMFLCSLNSFIET